ncbi:protein of unknown function DUF382 [Phytophthora cactorum]|nr:protein of unknown function DUF382 [Phytophthora cactorum]
MAVYICQKLQEAEEPTSVPKTSSALPNDVIALLFQSAATCFFSSFDITTPPRRRRNGNCTPSRCGSRVRERRSKQGTGAAAGDPAYEEMMRVFGRFSSAEELCGATDNEVLFSPGLLMKFYGIFRTARMTIRRRRRCRRRRRSGEGGGGGRPDSVRKARKKSKRLSVAELKQLVSYPDVVEAHDVTSADPRLLVYLKSYRNTVPVPRHWCHKRKYLQGKRGFEKQPFQLPEFIAQTGIAEVRDSVAEEMRRRETSSEPENACSPRWGVWISTTRCCTTHSSAFQTKPKLTQLGDVYYEGKEFEVKLKSKVPGQLSDELKAALGMVEGVPPPWLLNVQRYGPPPAYPNLKIPGLNAPIPEGASFGYHPGGWGDVFGKAPESENQVRIIVVGCCLQANNFCLHVLQGEEINRERWGELEEQEGLNSLAAVLYVICQLTFVSVSENAEEEEEEEGEGEEEQTEGAVEGNEDADGLDATGLETPLVDGISSVASGLTTPGVVDLRKGIRGTETPDVPQQLYTVLEQKETSVGTSLYGSGHAYVVPGGAEESSGTRKETGRVRRRFEDAPPSESTNPRKTKTRLPRRKRKPRRTRARSSRISNSKCRYLASFCSRQQRTTNLINPNQTDLLIADGRAR